MKLEACCVTLCSLGKGNGMGRAHRHVDQNKVKHKESMSLEGSEKRR